MALLEAAYKEKKEFRKEIKKINNDATNEEIKNEFIEQEKQPLKARYSKNLVNFISFCLEGEEEEDDEEEEEDDDEEEKKTPDCQSLMETSFYEECLIDFERNQNILARFLNEFLIAYEEKFGEQIIDDYYYFETKYLSKLNSRIISQETWNQLGHSYSYNHILYNLRKRQISRIERKYYYFNTHDNSEGKIERIIQEAKIVKRLSVDDQFNETIEDLPAENEQEEHHAQQVKTKMDNMVKFEENESVAKIGKQEQNSVDSEKNFALKRLRNDYGEILRDPIPNVLVSLSPSNLLEWHFLLLGSVDTPYEGGYYHGKLLFPIDFPFKPPTIWMFTPSGCFQPNKPLYFSMFDDRLQTGNPSWTVSTIIMEVILFMNDTAETAGRLDTTEEVKRDLSKKSKKYNLDNQEFCRIFPDMVSILTKELEEEESEVD